MFGSSPLEQDIITMKGIAIKNILKFLFIILFSFFKFIFSSYKT